MAELVSLGPYTIISMPVLVPRRLFWSPTRVCGSPFFRKKPQKLKIMKIHHTRPTKSLAATKQGGKGEGTTSTSASGCSNDVLLDMAPFGTVLFIRRGIGMTSFFCQQNLILRVVNEFFSLPSIWKVQNVHRNYLPLNEPQLCRLSYGRPFYKFYVDRSDRVWQRPVQMDDKREK